MIVRLIVEALANVACVKQVVHNPDGVVAQLFGDRTKCQNGLRTVTIPQLLGIVTPNFILFSHT